MRLVVFAAVVGVTALAWVLFLYAWQVKGHLDPGVGVLCVLLVYLSYRVGRNRR